MKPSILLLNCEKGVCATMAMSEYIWDGKIAAGKVDISQSSGNFAIGTVVFRNWYSVPHNQCSYKLALMMTCRARDMRESRRMRIGRSIW